MVQQMRNVLKNYTAVLQAENTTVAQSWRQIVTSLEQIAMAHDALAEKLSGDMSEQLKQVSKATAQTRKALLAECAKEDANLEAEMKM